MKKLIRHNVFETNSSSCHSISISRDASLLETLYPNEDGIVVISGGQFGRSFERYNDASTKASYAATSTLYGLDEKVLKDVIKEQTGAIAVILMSSEDYNSPSWSYIDHESVGVCPRDKEELKNFIFNPNSWLFVAHDEGTPEPGFYDVLPIHTKDGVIEPTFTHEFSIPDISVSFKLTHLPKQKEIEEIISSVNFRWNSSKDRYELDENYWAGWEKYYEPSYYLKPEKGVISLVCDKFGDDEFKNEYGITMWGATKKQVKEFYKKHPERVKKIKYKINEIS